MCTTPSPAIAERFWRHSCWVCDAQVATVGAECRRLPVVVALVALVVATVELEEVVVWLADEATGAAGELDDEPPPQPAMPRTPSRQTRVEMITARADLDRGVLSS